MRSAMRAAFIGLRAGVLGVLHRHRAGFLLGHALLRHALAPALSILGADQLLSADLRDAWTKAELAHGVVVRMLEVIEQPELFLGEHVEMFDVVDREPLRLLLGPRLLLRVPARNHRRLR